jgi:hypothetical protein
MNALRAKPSQKLALECLRLDSQKVIYTVSAGYPLGEKVHAAGLKGWRNSSRHPKSKKTQHRFRKNCSTWNIREGRAGFLFWKWPLKTGL